MVTVRWGMWLALCLFAALAASVLLQVVPKAGPLSGLAILAGSAAYAMMATNLLLAARRPVLEKLFGPLDRVYNAHRQIGTAILAVIGVHLVLIPVASAVDLHMGVLAHFNVAFPIGIAGALLLVGSIFLAVNTKVSYDRWQKVHAATGTAFVILTVHMFLGSALWFPVTSPAGILLVCFALLGMTGFFVRSAGKIQGGVRYLVVQTIPRERGTEIILRPAGKQRIPRHLPGQFAFLTATVDGATETHPFTLTNAKDDDLLSVLICPCGDWTDKAQTAFAGGDEVRLDGPFGAFTPAVGPDGGPHQVWIAGGAGITPFLSVLRTAQHVKSVHGDIELVVAARDSDDLPCWEELSRYGRTLPWLTLNPAFSARGGRLDQALIGTLAASKPAGSDWYLCGPSGLTDMIEHALRADLTPRRVHREHYQWRPGRPAGAPSAKRHETQPASG